MRGELDSEEYLTIESKLPDVNSLTRRTNKLNVELISMVCGHKSEIPIAAVCLGDCTDTLSYGRIALHEIMAADLYYQKKTTDNQEMTSVWIQKFYADDLAFRLYACGEDLAKAIEYMLEIKKVDLKPFAKKRVSDQSIIGNYLLKHKLDHSVTIALGNLSKSSSWIKSINYRSKWTHEQAPIISGLGIIYKRKNRWDVSKNGKRAHMDLGVRGDEEDYSIAEVKEFLAESLHLLIDVVDIVVDEYESILEGYGVEINKGNGGHKFRAV